MTCIKYGNILDITSGIICHQVNCKGVMGSGLALQIRQKYPSAYNDYRKAYEFNDLYLGNVIFSLVSKDPYLFIAHLCGQYDYGRKSKVYTEYAALNECLHLVGNYRRVCQQYTSDMPQVYIPHNMSCGLAGGDWYIVSNFIERTIPDAIIMKYTG